MIATNNTFCETVAPAAVRAGDLIAVPGLHEHMIRVARVITRDGRAPIIDYGYARRPLNGPVYRALRDRTGIPIHTARL